MAYGKNISFTVKPIGVIHSPFKHADGTPIQAAFDKRTADERFHE